MEKRKEPGIMENGRYIPNRIFRGRIVEFTRRSQGKAISLPDLGKIIKKDYSSQNEEWLLSLLDRLRGDGLLAYQLDNHNIILFLPQ